MLRYAASASRAVAQAANLAEPRAAAAVSAATSRAELVHGSTGIGSKAQFWGKGGEGGGDSGNKGGNGDDSGSPSAPGDGNNSGTGPSGSKGGPVSSTELLRTNACGRNC